ncbi:MAG: SCO family protein [Alphaproteobacteria bacterium]|nr:SCO family protein [Alphaproteobacteria bacterium]
MRNVAFQVIVFTALFSGAGWTVAAAPTRLESIPAPVVTDDLTKLGRGIVDVTLADEAGQAIQWNALHGRPRALFFGFTHCPVICPVTVWELDTALKKIGKRADSVQLLFVTLDPERDTPAVMRSYFSSFGPRVRALTGTMAEIERVSKAFAVVRERVVLQGDDYTLDHTAAVFLLDSNGAVVDTLAYGTPQDVIVKRLENLLARTPVRKN